MRKALLLITSLIVLSISAVAQQTVFDIAHKLQGADIFNRADSNYNQLLAGVMWYAGIEELDSVTSLPEKLLRYPVLRSKYDKLSLNMSTSIRDKIFILTEEELRSLLTKNDTRFWRPLIDNFVYYQKFKDISYVNSIANYQKKKDSISIMVASSSDDTLFSKTDAYKSSTDKLGQLQEEIYEFEERKDSVVRAKNKVNDLLLKYPTSSLVIYNYLNSKSGVATANPSKLKTAQLYEAFNQLKEVYQTPEPLVEVKRSTPSAQTFETQMINEVAVFLVNRVKQETILWFYDNITSRDKWNTLAKDFFPESKKLLESKEVTEVPNMGVQWRYALAKDFAQMPENVLTSNALWSKMGNKAYYKDYIKTVIDISKLLVQNYNYHDLLGYLYQQNLLNNSTLKKANSDTITAKDMISLFYVLDKEFVDRDTVGRDKWVPLQFESLQAYTTREMNVVLSLLDLKYNGLFSKLFNKTHGDFQFSREEIELVRAWAGRILLASAELENIRNRMNSSPVSTVADGSSAIDFSNDIWSAYTTLLKSFSVSDNVSQSPLFIRFRKTNRIIGYAVTCQEVYRQLKNHNFSGAVSSVLTLMDSIRLDGSNYYLVKKGELDTKNSEVSFIKPDSKLSDNFKEMLLHPGEYDDQLKYLNVSYDKTNETYTFAANGLGATILLQRERLAYQNILKLAAFLGDISATKADSKLLGKIIESYAMPAQSYKRKRNSWWSVDLNAYVGAYYGIENISRTMDQPAQPGAKVYGLSAPIGVSVSKTFGRSVVSGTRVDSRGITSIRFGNKVRYKSKSTMTMLFSVIDLGAVVSYRVSNMDSTLPQQLKWQQFISPGLQLQYGFPSTPLVLGFGVQYTPALRRFETDPAKKIERQYNAVRFSTGIYFDIPLFNLWSRD